jgi:hypothetical protein
MGFFGYGVFHRYKDVTPMGLFIVFSLYDFEFPD